jgi:hypothetical protein
MDVHGRGPGPCYQKDYLHTRALFCPGSLIDWGVATTTPFPSPKGNLLAEHEVPDATVHMILVPIDGFMPRRNKALAPRAGPSRCGQASVSALAQSTIPNPNMQSSTTVSATDAIRWISCFCDGAAASADIISWNKQRVAMTSAILRFIVSLRIRWIEHGSKPVCTIATPEKTDHAQTA